MLCAANTSNTRSPVLSVSAAGITIQQSTFNTVTPKNQPAVLWKTLDLCQAAAAAVAAVAGQHDDDDDVLHDPDDVVRVGRDNKVPPLTSSTTFTTVSLLTSIDVDFPEYQPLNTSIKSSILGPLTTHYPAVVRSLRVLNVARSDFDDSAALGAFAALAARLEALTFLDCGLTSVRGLEGHCEYLRKVDLRGCRHLRSLEEGLGNRLLLEEVDASWTEMRHVEPLSRCPALTKVSLFGCRQLSSIEGLAYHQWLREVYASYAAISSIEALRSCPALVQVDLNGCKYLTSIDALEGHQWLEEVNVSCADITSIEPLRTCPALTTLILHGCSRLSSIEALESHQYLKEVNASYTAITTVKALRTCPALTTLDLSGCAQLPARHGLPPRIEVSV